MTAALTPRTSSPTPSNASSFVDDARLPPEFPSRVDVFSTRAIFDGTPGNKPRIEFVENLSNDPFMSFGEW